MKKIKIIVLVILLAGVEKVDAQTDDGTTQWVTMMLGSGVDLAPHDKATGPYYLYEFDFNIEGAFLMGVNFSGKNGITRMLSDGTKLRDKYYKVSLLMGGEIPKWYSPVFMGSGVGVAGSLLWDNFRIDPTFPGGVGPFGQIRGNMPIGGKYSLGLNLRVTYMAYFYKSTNPYDLDQKTNPMVQMDASISISF